MGVNIRYNKERGAKMVGLSKREPVYVTYTCKKCGSAFVDLDPNDDINETPLKNRYCPDCVAKGYTNGNFIKKITPEQQRLKDIKAKLKANNITDDKDVAFVKKYINKQIQHKEATGQKIFLNYIFNDALEVLGYQSWKQ